MYSNNGVRDCVDNFGNLVSKGRFLKLQGFALKMHSLFANAYVCVSTFYTMKQVQSEKTNWMAHETLDHSLRLATINTSPTLYSFLYQYHKHWYW